MLRQMIESLVLLAIAVVLFRSFAAEGYMISTGSMAPSLLGFHRQIECPGCHFHFARGAAFDTDTEPSSEFAYANHSGELDPEARAVCPNCGRSDINARAVPRNEGDQLLVHKHVFQFRDPRRWEVAVFRNPSDQRQAYVKRVIGLPGETIEVRHGDIYANGILQRKPFATQQAMRIPVADSVFQVEDDDPDWRERWSVLNEDSLWQRTNDFIFNGVNQVQTDWLEYRHWIRQGGSHETSLPFATWPEHLELPSPEYNRLQYRHGQLIAVGALTDRERNLWKVRFENDAFHAALDELFERSHRAPISDLSGYNVASAEGENITYDFMAKVAISDVSGTGRFEIELANGNHIFTAVADFAHQAIHLFMDDELKPVRTVPFPADAFEENAPLVIEFSLFDAQAIVGVNGDAGCEPFAFEPGLPVPVRSPLRFGAAGIACRVQQVQLFRDVYYTDKSKSGIAEWKLDEDDFFVLGDNSPVSVDSRVWDDPAVPRSALIGKPVVVHLPSQQGTINWGGKTRHVRIPDFSKVRYIR